MITGQDSWQNEEMMIGQVSWQNEESAPMMAGQDSWQIVRSGKREIIPPVLREFDSILNHVAVCTSLQVLLTGTNWYKLVQAGTDTANSGDCYTRRRDGHNL